MELRKIEDPGSPSFREAWKIYQSSFPGDERRSLRIQAQVLRDPRYVFFSVHLEDRMIGILTAWRMGTFTLIDHFAIKRKLRGRGFGTRLMREYLSKNHGKIVLEAERFKTSVAKRRIQFYQKLGFKLNRQTYVQPPYGKGKKPVPGFLLSYPETITGNDFPKIRDKIYGIAYGLKKPEIQTFLAECRKANL